MLSFKDIFLNIYVDGGGGFGGGCQF